MSCGCLSDRRKFMISLQQAVLFFIIANPVIADALFKNITGVTRTLLQTVIFLGVTFLLMKYEKKAYSKVKHSLDRM